MSLPHRPLIVLIDAGETGRCNICGEVGMLTFDHVPPQAAFAPTAVMVQHIAFRLRVDSLMRGRIRQNGMSFRSICHRCNNTVLGKQYDPHLIDLVERIRPQRVARSVLGHLTASGLNRYDDADPTCAQIRACMLDPAAPLPSRFRLYTWLYPFPQSVIVRDAVLSELPGSTYTFWLLKFQPIAFMVIWEGPSLVRPGIRDFGNLA